MWGEALLALSIWTADEEGQQGELKCLCSTMAAPGTVSGQSPAKNLLSYEYPHEFVIHKKQIFVQN